MTLLDVYDIYALMCALYHESPHIYQASRYRRTVGSVNYDRRGSRLVPQDAGSELIRGVTLRANAPQRNKDK